jgi:hypothetical protein
MKQYKITFTEEQWNQFESLIGELPTKFGVPLLNQLEAVRQNNKINAFEFSLLFD